MAWYSIEKGTGFQVGKDQKDRPQPFPTTAHAPNSDKGRTLVMNRNRLHLGLLLLFCDFLFIAMGPYESIGI